MVSKFMGFGPYLKSTTLGELPAVPNPTCPAVGETRPSRYVGMLVYNS